ncbi:MAG TPA: hypothetical protein VK464_14670, partial [Symbiobacteriaceae bacterium]|nr:hypothetical protein [Symbiobacteriaceae bacterium]
PGSGTVRRGRQGLRLNGRHAALMRWGLAAVYLAIVFALLLLVSPGLRLVLGVLYLCLLAWRYWTWESREKMLRPLTAWDVPEVETFRGELTRA